MLGSTLDGKGECALSCQTVASVVARARELDLGVGWPCALNLSGGERPRRG